MGEGEKAGGVKGRYRRAKVYDTDRTLDNCACVRGNAMQGRECGCVRAYMRVCGCVESQNFSSERGWKT